jgi:UDP-4-amino-4,6-dideoxy-N-acetyl-beta-L-altrosamine transaminase
VAAVVIPYGRQAISDEDVQAVIAVLRSDYLTQGPAVAEFEQRLASWCGCRFGVAANSATSALHLACLALGVGPGDRVWTSPVTFVASANAALYCGANVDFVDIDPRTYNMCAAKLDEKLRQAARDGKLPKVIIPVHLTGQSCDMAAIKAVADGYGVKIIEDASHAVGSTYLDAPVGSCQFSDIAVFSFHPVKIITTGEGGMAMTNDPQLAERMGMDRTSGITRDPALMQGTPHGPWYYEQLRLGFNYRMPDLAAALGLSQFDRLDLFVTRRHEIAQAYDAALDGLPVTIPWQRPDTRSAFHLYVVRVDRTRAARDRLTVFERLRSAGIGVNLHYIPVYKQPFYRALGFPEDYCPEAEAYYAEAISLPMFPALTDQEQRKVIDTLARAVTP